MLISSLMSKRRTTGEKAMNYLQEGLEKLATRDIPFTLVCKRKPRLELYVRMPEECIEELREMGFRVGSKIPQDRQFVYYKGEFFGLTAK
jgi:hypothetical protein